MKKGQRKLNDLTSLIRPVNDAIETLSGKWKLPVLIALHQKNIRFSDLARLIPGITDRMLAKELQQLEENLLVRRIIHDREGISIATYALTEHANSLHHVIIALADWGNRHRKVVVGH
jgi:DNA-binding HxlR family transcriptional regulator